MLYYYKLENLTIIVRIVGPRFRFHMPEIDFGLMSVGDVSKKILLFSNEGSINISHKNDESDTIY